MATLEKIRSKSVLLIVVIGVALLAFIVGDALTNSRNLFGDGSTVAKVDGEKIDYTEYQQKREEINNQYEQMRQQSPQQAAQYDPQTFGQMAIDALIDEKLIDRAADKLGIGVSGDMLSFFMFQQPLNQQGLMQLIQAMNGAGMQVQTPEQAYEIIFNPKRNGLTDQDVAGLQRQWLAIENDTKKIARRVIYSQILDGTFQANELEKKALYNNDVNTKSLRLAQKPLINLDPKKYPVSDAEIKAEYDKLKNLFKVTEPTKTVSFIAVNVPASKADQDAAKALARKTVEALRDSGSVLSKELVNQGVDSKRRTLRASDISGVVKNYLTTAPKDSAAIVQESIAGFTVVKLLGKKAEVDSMQLNIVQVAGKKLPSQVLAALNGGLAIDSVGTKFPKDSVFSQKEQWIPLYTAQGATEAFQPAQLDSLRNAGGRFIILDSNDQASLIAQVAKQTEPKEVYTFDEVTYSLNPSNKTFNDAVAKFEKFLAQNNTADKFVKNAAKAGYTTNDFELSQSVPAIPGMMQGQYYPESRQVVRWVMIDGDEGEVSHVYSTKQNPQSPMLYAVAILDEYDDYMPVDNKFVKEQLTDRVRRSKAGDDFVKQYKGKNLDAIAKAMNSQAVEIPGFRFNAQSAQSIGDAVAVGRIASSKPGATVYVVKGDNGVYAYTVNGDKKENFEYNDAQYKNQYNSLNRPNNRQLLRGAKKIKNNSYKFEAGE